MAQTPIQSIEIPLAISIDGNTYKRIVCLTSANFNADRATTKEETQCGVITSVGTVSWGFDFDAVVNATPTTASEFSYKDILDIFWGGQPFIVRQAHPDTGGSMGTDAFITGSAYLTNIKNAVQVGSAWKFSGHIEGTGILDITP